MVTKKHSRFHIPESTPHRKHRHRYLISLGCFALFRKTGLDFPRFYNHRIYSVAIASNRSAKRSCQMPGARCQGRYLSNCHLKDETECLQTGTIITISFHFTYRRYVKYRPRPLATGNGLLNSYGNAFFRNAANRIHDCSLQSWLLDSGRILAVLFLKSSLLIQRQTIRFLP